MHVTHTMGGPAATRGSARGHGWRIAWGVLLIVAGLLALVMPVVAAVATAWFLGYLLLFGGVIEIVYAMQTRDAPGFGWKLFSGIVTLVLGLALVFMPLAGAATLALWVAAVLFVGGVIRTSLAVRLKPLPGWGWVLFDGLLSMLLAVLVLIGWPQHSIAFIGFLTGFWLLAAGLWRIVLPGTARAAP